MEIKGKIVTDPCPDTVRIQVAEPKPELRNGTEVTIIILDPSLPTLFEQVEPGAVVAHRTLVAGSHEVVAAKSAWQIVLESPDGSFDVCEEADFNREFRLVKLEPVDQWCADCCYYPQTRHSEPCTSCVNLHSNFKPKEASPEECEPKKPDSAIPSGARWKTQGGVYYRVVGKIIESLGYNFPWGPSFTELAGEFPSNYAAECALDEHARRERWKRVGE